MTSKVTGNARKPADLRAGSGSRYARWYRTERGDLRAATNLAGELAGPHHKGGNSAACFKPWPAGPKAAWTSHGTHQSRLPMCGAPPCRDRTATRNQCAAGCVTIVRYLAEQRRIMARKCLRARWITLLTLAVTVVAGCGTAVGGARPAPPRGHGAPGRPAGSSQAGTSRPQARRSTRAGCGYPAAFVAAVGRSIRSGPHGLAAFSSSDGRLLRWLVRSAPDPFPVAVSPNGRWLYYTQYAPTQGRCPNTGFVDPVLWKVPAGGGRPRRSGLRTPSIAFSPDGRMVAYTKSSGCGRLLRIVVRNRRTGATRRILLAHNDLRGNNQVGSAQLSWAPDDAHLAVAVAPAAAINGLSVINALRARNAITARDIWPCAGDTKKIIVGCLNPGFDIHGRLTFLKWREGDTPNSFAEWVVRWHRGRAGKLFRLSGEQSADGSASIAVNRTGNAVLPDGGQRYPEIWRWYRGPLRLILRSTPGRRVVWNPLWLRGSR